MMDLPLLIADAVANGNFLVSIHAQRRLRERGIELWQIEAGVEQWIVEEVRPDDLPNPSIKCRQELPDGASVTAIWAWVPEDNIGLLVTVFPPN
jgi:hypothetical protein